MVVKKQKNPPSSKNRAKTKDPPSSKKKKKKAIYPWAVQPELQQLILDVQPKLQQLIQDIRHVTVAVDWDARLPHSVLGTDSSPVPLQVPYSQDLVAFQSPARLEIQTSKLTAVATAVAPVASTTMPFSAAPMMVSSVSIISTGVDSIDTGTTTTWKSIFTLAQFPPGSRM
ncbi:hypothetical protein FRACYDRAFT_244535 [Fragilariopsis cylindrus CCMP1102]|uniref:Uncharacterized protein n=1 Tax=Fragilariopsis cylindrus CCMP1102 TaxID=635003 RepID=A0A1E7F267_9STRA|nr:hypothetical protein FRACYDRAFT_244535 [Fragilariopsis cylindrus CCMP1102]|eukprot:OEU12272.1 hypothetical protein FRACYDRAFT_244535 [Fragilariopsis cylindrus CCMP1102]